MNAIELENVVVAFQTGNGMVTALNNLSLQIQTGTWTSVIGQNGSGKSTLARVMANLTPISRGKIRVAKTAAKGALPVQMVFQNPEAGLIGETVFEDVAFGLSVLQVPANQMQETVHQALLPFGLQKWMDKPVADLSGGQKQLLCMASCLALNPDILIFDECTSMLDEKSRQLVRESVKELQKSGKTIIWLTQHLEELAYADTTVVLENGRIVWQGLPKAFFYSGPSRIVETAENSHAEHTNQTQQQEQSWCRTLGFTPPYVVQVAEHLRQMNESPQFQPLTVAELVEGRDAKCPSN